MSIENLAPLIGLWLSPLTIAELILMMFMVSFALTAFGVVIASSMSSFEGFGTISNFVVMPMYFLSGAIYPTSTWVLSRFCWMSAFWRCFRPAPVQARAALSQTAHLIRPAGFG